MDTPDPPSDDALKDLVLDLNFVPEWAKGPAEKVQYDTRRHDREDRRGDRRGRDRRRDGDRNRNRRDDRGDRRGGGGGGRRGEHRGPDRGHPRDRRGPPPIRRAPVRVDFMPDRARLGKVVHLIRHSKRAYDLQDIAHRFMASVRRATIFRYRSRHGYPAT